MAYRKRVIRRLPASRESRATPMFSVARWSAKTWVDGEVEANIDSYGNTPRQAAEFVLDMLSEGEYREELNDEQIAAAISIVRKVLAQHADHPR